MEPYILGIFWAIGNYVPGEKVFILRHRDRYFLDAVKRAVGSHAAVRAQVSQKKYILKLGQYCLNVSSLKNAGWAERNSQERPYPDIDEHRSFIRGYFEIHGRVSRFRLRNKNGRVQIQHRLRIYGNEKFLLALNEILAFELRVSERNLEPTSRPHSKVLSYYKKDEIIDIFEWIFDCPPTAKNQQIENKFRETLRR